MFHQPSLLGRVPKTEKLLRILLDGQWHGTRELARRVGHTFIVAKFALVHRDGHRIESRRHPDYRFQWQYRLVLPDAGARR